MKLWALANTPPASDDIVYLIGCCTARSTKVFVNTVPADATRPPPAPEEEIDIILNRCSDTRVDFIFHLDELAARLAVPLTNPGAAAIRACDKRTYLKDFPKLTPPSRVAQTLGDVLDLQRELDGELVLKDPFGKHGKNIIRFRGEEDSAEALRLLDDMKKSGVVAQAFCHGFVSGDKRIIMQRRVGGGFDFAAWFKRVPKEGEWKSNISAGGRVERCELDREEKDLAMAVAEAAGLDCIGIDLAWHDGRCLLIETNAYPGGHIDFDVDRRVQSGDGFAQMVVHLAEQGRP